MKLTTAKVILLIFAASRCSLFAESSGDGTQDTGIEWPTYGVAVISQAKSATLTIDFNSYRLTAKDSNFHPLLEWIKDHFQYLLDRAPERPVLKNWAMRLTITLYASDNEDASQILIHIPVTKFTLRLKDGTEESKFSQLKAFFGRTKD